MNTFKAITFGSIAALSALLSVTAQAADNSASADSGFLLLEHKDHGSCNIPLTNHTVERWDIHADIPGCPFRAPTSIRFVNAPSAVTVKFRSFEHARDVNAKSDCDGTLTKYPYRLTIKTAAAINGTGGPFNIGDMLRGAIDGAVAPHVRLVARSSTADNGPNPDEYLACLIIETGDQ